MSALNKLIAVMKDKNQMFPNLEVVFPDVWQNFDKSVVVLGGSSSIKVNPYCFILRTLNEYYLPFMSNELNYGQSYHQIFRMKRNRGDWIKKSIIYSLMIRTSTAYDMDESGLLEDDNLYGLNETGTFVKTLLILPYLKKMGVDVLYLLPIGKFSLLDKKGELGSPYGLSNFLEIDQSLSDKLVKDEMTIEEQFQALVEGCHVLGIKVVIDIIPRTNSVNSELIIEHPDWFYWIEKDQLANYKPPFAPGINCGVSADKKYFDDLFKSEEVKEHLKLFRDNPRQIDSSLWQSTIQRYSKQQGRSFLSYVHEDFGLTIAPAFSDCINDPQPVWSDVTYFRLYLDHPENSKPYLSQLQEVKPYILYDVAKASLNPGLVVNEELWECLSNIIPYYQNKFGIDGARIDMGHALPDQLIARIIKKARIIDNCFCFIAEEMEISRALNAKKASYNCIIGSGFKELIRVYQRQFNAFVYQAVNVELPQFAAVETHDTPRVAAREGGKALTKMTSIFNYFIPNTIPFINSGQEYFEIQPMNTGLDCRENEAYLLNPNDQYYGKLALFDRYQFHYNNDRFELITALSEVLPFRKKYLNLITNKKKAIMLNFAHPSDLIVGVGYIAKKKFILVLANADIYNSSTYYCNLENIAVMPNSDNLCQIYSSVRQFNPPSAYDEYWFHQHFEAGEVKIFELNCL